MQHGSRAEQAAKAKGFRNILTTWRCVRYLHFLADVSEILKRASLVFQQTTTGIGQIYPSANSGSHQSLEVKAITTN